MPLRHPEVAQDLKTRLMCTPVLQVTFPQWVVLIYIPPTFLAASHRPLTFSILSKLSTQQPANPQPSSYGHKVLTLQLWLSDPVDSQILDQAYPQHSLEYLGITGAQWHFSRTPFFLVTYPSWLNKARASLLCKSAVYILYLGKWSWILLAKPQRSQ